jgi:hypothetical protein
MSVEIQWNDTDPDTGEKRFVSVERFAGKWQFLVRLRRREPWESPKHVTRDMWETLLEALERRYTRREGVSEADLAAVRMKLANYRDPPTVE